MTGPFRLIGTTELQEKYSPGQVGDPGPFPLVMGALLRDGQSYEGYVVGRQQIHQASSFHPVCNLENLLGSIVYQPVLGLVKVVRQQDANVGTATAAPGRVEGNAPPRGRVCSAAVFFAHYRKLTKWQPTCAARKRLSTSSASR